MNYLNIYNKLPCALQNIAVSIEGKRIQVGRYGTMFNKEYSFWKSNRNWTQQDYIEYRDKQIEEIFEYSIRHVPYYQKLYKNLDIKSGDVKCLDDLKKLPVIDKEIVRANQHLLLSDVYDEKVLKTYHTSGTTGAGLILKVTDEFDAHNWAIGWDYHNRIGITRDLWCAYFAGRPIVPNDHHEPPFYRINIPGKQIMFSSFHMNDRNLYSYIDAMNKYQPPWFHGYPSAVALLANFINRTGYKLNYAPKVITLSSENVLNQQKEEINRAFGIYPHQTYGQTEGVAYFRDYKPGEIYVVEHFSGAEFVKMDDGETHIVGTNFNKAMPLIRYDTHDIARCIDTEKGRRVISIDGRKEDYIITKDGSKIGRLDHIFKDAENVLEAQIVQQKDGKVNINIVRTDAYTFDDEMKIRLLADERLQNRVEYSINYKEKIERARNGKLRFVISNME